MIPTTRKYVEVLFKCKPASFRSRVVCAGETVALACSPTQPDFRSGFYLHAINGFFKISNREVFRETCMSNGQALVSLTVIYNFQ